MPDLIHAIAKRIDYDRYTVMAIIIVAIILGMAVGCQPTAKSPFDGQKVTQLQLEAQVKAEQARIDAKVKTADLTYQQTIADLQAEATAGQVKAQAAMDQIEQDKQAIQIALEAMTQVAAAAAGPQYAGLISTAVGVSGALLGIGVASDAARKNKIILEAKQDNKPVTT